MTIAHEPEPWRARAACRLANATLFDDFLDSETEMNAQRQYRHAKARAHCRRCPVGFACLSAAVTARDTGIRNGVLLRDGKPAARPGRKKAA